MDDSTPRDVRRRASGARTFFGTIGVLAVATLAPARAGETEPGIAAAPSTEWTLERWQVDATRSTVGFDGSSTLHDFTGKTRSIAGEIRFDPAAVDACAGGTVWIEARTLDTDNSKRDEEMRATLNVAQYPYVVFTLDRVEGRMVERRGEFRAHGRFFVNGYEQPKIVSFRTEPRADGALHVLGETHLSLREHDLDPPSVLFVSVDDDVRVWLDLVLTRVPDELVAARESSVEVTARTAGVDAPRTWRGTWLESANGVIWSGAGRGPERAPGVRAGIVRAGGTELWDLAHGARLDAATPAPAGDASKPAPKPLDVTRRDVDARTVVLLVGGRETVRLEGLAGEAPAASLLPALDGFPSGLEAALRGVRGRPERVQVATTDAEGRARTLDVVFRAEERAARVPSWAFDPNGWPQPPDTPKRRLATAQDWRSSQKDDG